MNRNRGAGQRRAAPFQPIVFRFAWRVSAVGGFSDWAVTWAASQRQQRSGNCFRDTEAFVAAGNTRTGWATCCTLIFAFPAVIDIARIQESSIFLVQTFKGFPNLARRAGLNAGSERPHPRRFARPAGAQSWASLAPPRYEHQNPMQPAKLHTHHQSAWRCTLSSGLADPARAGSGPLRPPEPCPSLLGNSKPGTPLPGRSKVLRLQRIHSPRLGDQSMPMPRNTPSKHRIATGRWQPTAQVESTYSP